MSEIKDLFIKSSNKIIELAYCDLQDFDDELTDKRIIEEIEWKICTIKDDEDSDYIRSVASAEKLLSKMKNIFYRKQDSNNRRKLICRLMRS